MTTPYLGEIQLFGFNYAPQGWAQCEGQTLPLSQFSALYTLLGVQYGGNGTSNFMLPNFSNRTPASQGRGPGLTPRSVGDTVGENSVTLLATEMPAHGHGVLIYNQSDNSKRTGTPVNGAYLSNPHSSSTKPYAPLPGNTLLAPQTLGVSGGNQPHENRQPFLALNFCIALEGVYPSFG
ncbi:tail fiber protein [Bacillus sp. NP157]|nr:tail fiber protein [Bacillus sp. NP157]